MMGGHSCREQTGYIMLLYLEEQDMSIVLGGVGATS